MPLKRKTRNLPDMNDQMSFFDPVYQNDGIEISDDDLLADGIPRDRFLHNNQGESNETLDTDTITNVDQDPSSSEMISASKIVIRVKQIQNSIQQARAMLESMEKFKNLVPGSDEQSEKLQSIIANLEEQQAGYVNLLNLMTFAAEERSAITNRNPTSLRQMNTHDDDDNDLSLRRNIQSPVRPRIESKIGFTPRATIAITPTVPPTINVSDNEQTNRNDYSNYDSLVGSLKSDRINWKDQQSTSDDEASDVEIERNLMLHKEQLRALQGQKRALLALKRRSEKQRFTNKKETDKENDLLSDINNLRDRLRLIGNIYEEKYQIEMQQLKNSSNIPSENRLKNLGHVRERLDELEQIVAYYQSDLTNQPDDAQRVKTRVIQQTTNNDTPKQLDTLSDELTAKRLELEQAKSVLSQLQQMVKKIQPDECSSSARSTPVRNKSLTKNNDFELCTNQFLYTPTASQHHETETSIPNTKTSLLSNILSPKQGAKSVPTTNANVDVKMAAQHREIERLVESRQRLHTIKDQIASLHQSMTTPPVIKESPVNKTQTYEDKLNDSRNLRPSYRLNRQQSSSQDDDDELYQFECGSGDGEEIDDDDDDAGRDIQTNSFLSDHQIQSRIKQSNFHTPEEIVAEHEQHLLNKNTDQLSSQMRDVCHCLSSFIEEQKSFNRHIEERLLTATNTPTSNTPDPVFNQLQQQVVTQGLIVNLNTAYREIAVLQSEVNALQSENNRLTSSISFDNQYHHIPNIYSRDNSKTSIYSFDQIKTANRPQPRSRFDEQLKQQNHLLTTNNHKFENSSKASFNSQSTGEQTAIHVEKKNIETTPMKHERNAKFATEHFSSSKPLHLPSKQISDTYDLPNRHHHSPKEHLSKSFVIRRRPISTDNNNSHLYDYEQKLDEQSLLSSMDDYQQLQQHTYDSDDEQESNDFSKNVFNIQPSAYSTSATQDLDNIDIQTLDLQVKSIMVQLIPFMRLHINEIFNQSILNHIRERIIFLFKQQPDSAQLIRHFQNQFSELLGKTIEKYCGTTVREGAADLIRDISDVSFDELVKYKVYENTNNQIEQNTQALIKQQDEYSHLYDPTIRHDTQQTSAIDDGENDNKYQIELAESENRPLTLIGSDEDDNDSDQEENKDNELETAVSRQEINLHQNEIPTSTELNSNEHEYILVNRPASNDIVPENEEVNNPKNEVSTDCNLN